MNIILLILLLFVVPVIPLYIVVKVLGGNITFFSALGIKITAGVIALLGSIFLGSYASLIVTVLLILIYRMAFDLGIIRAFLAWLLEIIMIGIIVFVLVAFFSVSVSGILPWF